MAGLYKILHDVFGVQMRLDATCACYCIAGFFSRALNFTSFTIFLADCEN